MNSVHERYLSAEEFLRYARKLNLDYNLKDLERFEKDGVLQPVARIVKPDEYVLDMHMLEQDAESWEIVTAKWSELAWLLGQQTSLDDEFKLWHRIDKAFEVGLNHLYQPEQNNFKEWSSYHVKVLLPQGDEIYRTTVLHYYHRWQVYILHAIEKRFPIYAKHEWLIQRLNNVSESRSADLLPTSKTLTTGIFEMRKHLDMLSFYSTLAKNEHKEVFRSVNRVDGVKQLTEAQYEQYKSNLVNHANFALTRYQLSVDALYEFVILLLDWHNEYTRAESLKLADELYDDIITLTLLLIRLTDQTMEQLEEHIGSTSTPWIKQKFRHLDKSVEVYDSLRDEFEYTVQSYNSIWPEYQLSSSDIERLIQFIKDNSLFIIPHAVHEILAILGGKNSFRSTSLYICLTNWAIGLECFLRVIATTANTCASAAIDTKSMFTLITTMFSHWGTQFNQEHQSKKGIHGDNASSYILDIYTESSLSEELKAFLIAYRFRNYGAHNYPLNQELYQQLFPIVVQALSRCFFYTWAYASQKNWI